MSRRGPNKAPIGFPKQHTNNRQAYGVPVEIAQLIAYHLNPERKPFDVAIHFCSKHEPDHLGPECEPVNVSDVLPERIADQLSIFCAQR